MATDLTVTSGMILDIPFNEGSGNVAHDQSGNGRDLTLVDVGTPHTWSGGALNLNGGTYGTFGGAAILPESVQTVIVVIKLGLPSVALTPNILLGNSAGGDPHWLWWFGGSAGNGVCAQPAYYVPFLTYVTGQGFYSWMLDDVYTMVAITTDPTPVGSGGVGDQWYIDDFPDQKSQSLEPVSALGLTNTGAVIFGASDEVFTGTYLTASLVRKVMFDRPITQAEMTTLKAEIHADALSRGIQIGGFVNPDTSYKIFNDGDSISAGQAASSATLAWENIMLAALTGAASSAKLWDYGIPGQSIQQIALEFAARRTATLVCPGSKNVYAIFAGTNGYISDNTPISEVNPLSTGSGTFPTLVYLINLALASGYGAVLVIPMLSREGEDADKNEYNGRMIAEWGTITESTPTPKVPGVYLIDPTNMAPMCNDGEYSNATYFNPSDQTHPLDPGHAIIGSAAAFVVNLMEFPSGPGYPSTATLSGPSTSGVGFPGGNLTVTLDEPAPSGGIVIDLISSDPSDTFQQWGTGATSSIAIPEGQLSAIYQPIIGTLGSRYVAISTTLNLSGSPLAITGVAPVATLTVVPGAAHVVLFYGRSYSFTATLTGSSATLSFIGPEVGTMSIGAPLSGVPFQYIAPESGDDAVADLFYVNDATDAINNLTSITLVNVPPPSTYGLFLPNATEGVASEGVVFLADGDTLASDLVITPTGSNVTLPGTITITAGNTSQTFAFTPTATGTLSVSTTNGSGLTDPSSASFTSSAPGGGGVYPAQADVRLATVYGPSSNETGTLIVPPASKVLTTATYDASTVGTVVLPTTAQVISIASFGPASDLTGTVVLPATADVRLATTFGPSSGSTGSLHVPTASQVLTGIAVDATTGNVTLPTAAQVLASITFGPAAASTGTVVLPSTANVESGITYGPGSDLTGTYAGGGGGATVDQITALLQSGITTLAPSPESLTGTVVSATTTSVTFSPGPGTVFNTTVNAYATGIPRYLTFTSGANLGLPVTITGSSVASENLTVSFAATVGIVAASSGNTVQLD